MIVVMSSFHISGSVIEQDQPISADLVLIVAVEVVVVGRVLDPANEVVRFLRFTSRFAHVGNVETHVLSIVANG